jgi:hypothetical protein
VKTKPPLIVSGNYKEMPLTIYGENHSNIHNAFYEELDLSGKHVLVEHSTLFCKLQPGEEALFAKAKGSEWVWFTRTVNGEPVICIDSRIEDGFLNRLEEEGLVNGNVTPEILLDATKKILMAITKIKHKFTPVKAEYMQIVPAIQGQFKQIMLNIKNEERDEALVEELIANLLKISNLSVDMNIIEKLDEYAKEGNTRPIVIFVGVNHAERLQGILGLSKGGAGKSKSRKSRKGRKRTIRKRTKK